MVAVAAVVVAAVVVAAVVVAATKAALEETESKSGSKSGCSRPATRGKVGSSTHYGCRSRTRSPRNSVRTAAARGVCTCAPPGWQRRVRR